jgi:hypothetical protein
VNRWECRAERRLLLQKEPKGHGSDTDIPNHDGLFQMDYTPNPLVCAIMLPIKKHLTK